MAHLSEDSQPLEIKSLILSSLKSDFLPEYGEVPAVYLFRFPAHRSDSNAACSEETYHALAQNCAALHPDSVICILTSPPDAARLISHLERSLHFQLWIAVKTPLSASPKEQGTLPESHAALLVFTRYRGALRHTKTRIQYTYCPACGKTTKDYGGKKHIYHEYGTLMADVWRDMEIALETDIEPILRRLRDMFGLPPYDTLRVIDLRACRELKPASALPALHETSLPFEWKQESLPLDSRLINGDCLEVLRTLPDNSIDFCFADPPYNIQKKYDHWDDALESIEYFAWCDQWLAELGRVLKPGRTLTVINIPLWAVRHYQYLCTRMNFQAWIAWEALGFPVRLIMPAHYAILCVSKGEPRPLPGLTEKEHSLLETNALTPLAENFCLRNSCVTQRKQRGLSDAGTLSDLWYDIHRLKHNSRRVDHPCQLPPQLMRRLFALFTRPGEIILDCFNGAGTSTLVAQQMGRRFTGIELSPQYHRLAEERHAQLAQGVDPFRKQDNVPKAKNSPVGRLPKQNYAVSKKTLQMEVKRIAQSLGRLPTREEVRQLSPYPMEYYEQYFLSWGEVCAAARTTGMSELPVEQLPERTQLSIAFDES